GIMNGGVEHIVPSRIEKDEYQKAQTFMNDEQKATWQGLYEENGDIYKLTVNDEKELDKIDEELLKPIVIIYQLEQMQDPEVKEKINGMLSSGMMNNPAAMEEASKKMDEMIATVGDRTLKSMGIAYAKNCNKEAGLDAARMQQNYLWVCGGKMLLLTAFMVVIAAITSFLSSRVGASIGRNLRKEVFSNVMGYSNAEMDKFTTSSLITRATNDIQQVQMTSTMILRMVLMAPIMAAWGIVKVYQTKAHMSYIIVIGVIILVSLIGIVLVVTLPKFRIMQKLIDALNAVSREILTGVPVIRAFGREKTEEERFDVANKKLKDTQLFVNRVMTLLSPFMLIIMYGITIVITWVSAKKIDAGTLQVGAMTAFITYSMMIITSFLIITGMAIILPRAGVAADRIEEVRGTKTSITNRKGAVELKDCKGVVRFNNVSFKYPDADENVVSSISFDAL
ncbi:MAG: ABC transporter ATP-binding protein, partial [Mogibacterium sp.]|nr:ABC transporter ATP-binding protein [Mogibacterium sp.]